MDYQEFCLQYEAAESLPDEVARKEYEQRLEQGESAIMGIVGREACKIFWSEANHRLEDGDSVGPYFYENDNVLRGLAVWRRPQES